VLQYLLNSLRYTVVALRRQQRALSLSEDSVVDTVAAEDTITAVEAALDARAILARICAGMRPAERRVLQLRYAEDLPPREIATVLALPVEQVYLILADVKRRLRTRSDLQILRDRSVGVK
jgi:RNA polymerase sigma factor (sigma-70 family)